MNLNRTAFFTDNKGIALMVIIAFSFILRMPCLDKPLMKDEGRIYKYANLEYSQINKFIVEEEAHPPLFYYISKAWAGVNNSNSWMRLLSVIFGALTPAIIFLIASQLYNDDKVSLLAGFIASMSPNLIFISQMLRSYSAATFLIAAAVLFFVIYLNNRAAVYLILYGLAALLSMYTFYSSILMIAAITLYFLVRIRDFKKIEAVSFFIINFFVILMYAPWAPFMIEQVKGALNGSGSHEKIMIANRFGAYIGNIHIGAIAKGLAGVFHVDHALFSNIRMHTRLGLPVLTGIITSAFAALLFMIAKGGRYLTSTAKTAMATPFLFTVVFMPFILAVILNIVKGFGITQRYMGPCAAVSSIIIAGAVLSFRNKMRRRVVLAIILAFFLFRDVAVWCYNDKESKTLDSYILGHKRSDLVLSSEIDFFAKNKRYAGMMLLPLGKDNLSSLKPVVAARQSFYIVEFVRPITLLRDRSEYELAKQAAADGFVMVERKNIDDVISVELYERR